MSRTLHFEGIRDPDERFRQMFAVYNACQQAGVDVPGEVREFFDGDVPDPRGLVVELPTTENERTGAEELRVADIPKSVTILRVYIS